jgi:hypothetical protein
MAVRLRVDGPLDKPKRDSMRIARQSRQHRDRPVNESDVGRVFNPATRTAGRIENPAYRETSKVRPIAEEQWPFGVRALSRLFENLVPNRIPMPPLV